MEPNKILRADLLDIIFEGRNKAYGAYELRTTYPARVKKAMIVTGIVCFVFTTGILLANAAQHTTPPIIVGPEVTLSELPPEKQKEPIVIVQPIPKPVQVRTIADNIPLIVPDNMVKHTEVPTDDQVETVQIAAVTNNDGVDGDFAQAPLAQTTGAGTQLKSDEIDYTKEFPRVQIEAKFPGGLDAWKRFLEQNLNTEIPLENGAPVGRYTVLLSFIVDKDGNVSNIQALNDPGYGTAAEAIKVIKKSRQWTPAVQNGRNVIYRQQQSITFVVSDEG